MLFFSSSTPAPVNDEPASSDALAKAGSLSLQDASGKEHTLSSLLSAQSRTILLFIRHHHCGFCVEYIRACANDEKIKATTTNPDSKTKVIVIGHGGYEGINRYKEVSDCPFDMYVDSQKKIYDALGLNRRFLGDLASTKEVSIR